MFPTVKGAPQVPLETRRCDSVSQFFANSCDKTAVLQKLSERV
jgi:hypothetical protein